jgi:hypothetical protein
MSIVLGITSILGVLFLVSRCSLYAASGISLALRPTHGSFMLKPYRTSGRGYGGLPHGASGLAVQPLSAVFIGLSARGLLSGPTLAKVANRHRGCSTGERGRRAERLALHWATTDGQNVELTRRPLIG